MCDVEHVDEHVVARAMGTATAPDAPIGSFAG
jgi:hypothetical protein